MRETIFLIFGEFGEYRFDREEGVLYW